MAEYRTVKATSLTNVVRNIVKAGGSSDREAELVATNLVEANLSGHDSHGVGMVPRYIDAVKEGGLTVNQHVERGDGQRRDAHPRRQRRLRPGDGP